MSVVTVQQMADRVSALLGERLRVKGDTLEARLARAGRRLPRPVREAGAALAEATMMIRNPKLMKRVDDATVARAYDICLRHLNTIDPAAARRGLLLDALARIAFALLVVGVAFLAFARWRGLI
jgi:hypothetical protein